MAWPMVWPKFRMARKPFSVSSWPTTSALISQQRATTAARVFGFAPQQLRQIAFQLREQPGIVNDAVFDDFGETGAKLAFGQSAQGIEIAQHQTRLVKRAHEIFTGLQIDADLAADGAVHLRQQRRRHLHKRDAAQIRRGDEPGQIADHAAAERDDEGFAFEPVRREQVVAGLNGFQTFGRFTRRNHNQRRRKACRGEGIESRLGKPSADVGVGDDGAPRAEFQARAFAAELVNQTRRNFDRVTAIPQLYGNGAHGPRIKAERAVSKFCRSFSSLKLALQEDRDVEKRNRPQDSAGFVYPAGGICNPYPV